MLGGAIAFHAARVTPYALRFTTYALRLTFYAQRQAMTKPNNPLIQLEGIKKVFFTDEVETHALSNIHLQINRGEYVSIAGPSGCGKSTLLSILGLLDSPTEGDYVLNGKTVANIGP